MRDYQDLKIKSEKVIEDYKKFKDERYEKELLYKNCAPHIANFKENDNDKNIWEKITFEGEEEYLELSNLYKNKINNCFVYLTGRYFDGRVMNEFGKNLFIKEMKKVLLKNINKI